jgi:hypothetical protein
MPDDIPGAQSDEGLSGVLLLLRSGLEAFPPQNIGFAVFGTFRAAHAIHLAVKPTVAIIVSRDATDTAFAFGESLQYVANLLQRGIDFLVRPRNKFPGLLSLLHLSLYDSQYGKEIAGFVLGDSGEVVYVGGG